jgi:AsnC-like helix-turn-helix protein
VFVVSGGDDFLLHVAVPNTDALYALVIDRLTERPEVADVNTSIVYEHLRNFTVERLERAETHDGTRAQPKPTTSRRPRSDGSRPPATRKEGN